MSSLCPPQLVDFPAVQPYRQGLFSVASFPPVPDRLDCGLQWQPWSCRKAFSLADPGCPPDGYTLADDLAALGAVSGQDESEVFHVYAPFRCSAVGLADGQAQAMAETTLALGEQRAVELNHWTGVDTTTGAGDLKTHRLAHATDATVLGTGVSPARGLALLEGFAGKNYGGVASIHAPRELSAYLPGLRDGDQSGSLLTTRLGTKLAFGGGYSEANTGPDGTVPVAGTYWAYVTGQVAIWRGPTFILPPRGAQFDKATNMVSLVAMRSYVIGRDCLLGAVSITVPASEPLVV